MTLAEAIEYIQNNTTPTWTAKEIAGEYHPDLVDTAIATILNAVVKGELK